MESLVYSGITFYNPNKVDDINIYHRITLRDKRKGILIKQPCEICGSLKSEAHHEYYHEENYKIRWLCHKHHKVIHTLFYKMTGVFEARKQRKRMIDKMVMEKLISEGLKNYE